MGFYGNVTNATKTTFSFDRTFPNRWTMDQGVADDDVFIGRYVLVDYNVGSTGGNYTRVYKPDPTSKYFYFASTISGENDPSMVLQVGLKYYLTDGIGNKYVNPERFAVIYIVYNSDNEELGRFESYEALYEAYGEELDSDEPSNIRVEEISKYAGYVFQQEPVYILDTNTNIVTFYSCNGFQEYGDKLTGATKRAATFAPMADAPRNIDAYYENFAVDKQAYQTDNNGIGKGYDSTVWQKVYATEGPKYVMIAELNSVVPSFAVTADPPTLEPLAPHFDADSTNVFYRLHVQPAWGFRVGKTEDLEKQPSDVHVNQTGARWDNNSQAINWKYEYDYDGAIYYNKVGFEPAYYTKRENDIENEINITPTGSSGYLYTDYHKGNVVGNVEKRNDIQELTINLPILGDTIATIWNIIYGKGEKLNEDEEVYIRNRDISWNNISGLRFIKEAKEGSGFTYEPERTETLAGAINSVHDLMGMIISDEEIIDVEEASIGKIYYCDPFSTGTKKFYYKNRTFKYDATQEPGRKIVPLQDFNAKTYYNKVGENYYTEQFDYIRGNQYLYFPEDYIQLVNIYRHAEYKPNRYYYLDETNNYILDSNTTPTDNRQYYLRDESTGETIDFKEKMFLPTDANYLSQFNKEGEGVTNPQRLFYWDDTEKLYRPFLIGQQLTIPMLYLIKNYTYEKGSEIDTGDTTYIYDLTDALISEGIQVIDFKPNTFYYYDKSEDKYVLLTSEGDININLTYTSGVNYVPILNLEAQERFYEPNRYYYSLNDNYIFATEEGIFSHDYYTLKEPELTTGLFYEPNYYYYNDNGKDTLDTSLEFTEGREYYLLTERYVMNDNDLFPKGSKWRTDIDEIPEGVELGVREEAYEWKELTGFARRLNTINGLILQINEFLRMGDPLTRDQSTVQGCINTINDIITKFDELIPGQILAVDKYGRLSGLDVEDLTIEGKTLKERFDEESVARAQKDAELTSAIEAETTNRQLVDNTINTTLTTEIANRQAANEAINATLTAEIADRQSADEVINTALTIEVQSRTQQYSDLNSTLNLTVENYNTLEQKVIDLEIKSNNWDLAEQNIQSDWNETDTSSDAYILNKPDLTKIVQTNTKFSYNQGEGKQMTIQEMFDYIVELETKITTLQEKFDELTTTT